MLAIAALCADAPRCCLQPGLWSCAFCGLECTSSEVDQSYWHCSAALRDAGCDLPAAALEPAAVQALLGVPAHAHASLALEQQQSLVKVSLTTPHFLCRCLSVSGQLAAMIACELWVH
jgi:hypothetical protein